MKQFFLLITWLLGTLFASEAWTFESRPYGNSKKTQINPNSKFNFPKAMEIYNIDLTQAEDNSALIERLHADGKRVICFLSSATKPKDHSKSIEAAMNSGCDEVAVR